LVANMALPEDKPAPPEKKKTEATPARIAALIEQLGSEEYIERERASIKLGDIGAPALKQLRKALSSDDAEVRERARRLVTLIQRDLFCQLQSFTGHSGSVNGVAFAPDGKHAASADSRGIRLWDLATGKQLKFSEKHEDRVMAVAFSPDGKLLASGSED